MKFLFEEQPHQLRAVAAVADTFDGALLPPALPVGDLVAAGATGHAGYVLDRELLGENLRVVQAREGLKPSTDVLTLDIEDLLGNQASIPTFDVEMETGTGKTYVYIRTCLQLAQEFGLRKFVMVVHSQAIRAGVLKTFEQTRQHFGQVFPALKYGWGALSSSSALDDFLNPSDAPQFLVAMVQSFDRPDTNTLYRAPESMALWGSGRRIEQLAAMRPVLVVDEPQNMTTDKRKQALATFNPLLMLRYTATLADRFNIVYRLDARTAQEMNLVKSVAVRGVAAARDRNQAFVQLMGMKSIRRKPHAQLKVNVPVDGGAVAQDIITVGLGDDLEDETGLPAYAGWVVEEIERKPDRIGFTNDEWVGLDEQTETDRRGLWRDQLRATIRAHLQRRRQFEQDKVPVKVISLVFVESVGDYVGPDATLPALFDQEYREVVARYFAGEDFGEPDQQRVAYFATTKKGEVRDTRGLAAEREWEQQAYDLIIANRERLLEPETPSFVFSHSALREGWDNPNVFQVCFLRHTASPVERRQQVGRGLRLAVCADGTRLHEPELNRLTVVVDESFADFRKALNDEYKKSGIGAGGEAADGGGGGGGGLTIEDADTEVEVTLLQHQVESDEFRELWDRIRYRTRFHVELDTDALVQAVLASEEIKSLKRVRTSSNLVTSARLRYGTDGLVHVRANEISEAAGTQVVRTGPLPDLVRLIEDRLQSNAPPLNLTRATIGKILASAPYKDRAVRQPEQWAALVAEAIVAVAVEQMVNGIVYEPLPESDWWEAELIFDKTQTAYDRPEPPVAGAPWHGVLATREPGPNLHSHVIHDSRVERFFAEGLDLNTDVRLFCKLPRRFTIDTPVGRYSPDWAIVVDRDGTDRLYLVRETKATLDLRQLPDDQALRIRFATRHFGAAPNPPVNFDHTTDKDGLRLPAEDD